MDELVGTWELTNLDRDLCLPVASNLKRIPESRNITVWQNALQKKRLTASSLSLRPSISPLKVEKSALPRHFKPSRCPHLALRLIAKPGSGWPKTRTSKISDVAVESLPNLPAGVDIFLDANVFIYAFGGQSKQCLDLLFRCAREEVYGVTTIEAINEVTHRLMLAEALAAGVIRRARAQDLRGKTEVIRQLRQYWVHVDKIFNLNILILKPDENRLQRAHAMRSRYGLLTNDSLILAAMNEYGIGCLATRDRDFDHVAHSLSTSRRTSKSLQEQFVPCGPFSRQKSDRELPRFDNSRNLLFGRICRCRAFSYLIPTMDSIIEAIANRLRIRGDDFHPCNSQFQSFQPFIRYAPFITGISPFQSFQSSQQFKVQKFNVQ